MITVVLNVTHMQSNRHPSLLNNIKHIGIIVTATISHYNKTYYDPDTSQGPPFNIITCDTLRGSLIIKINYKNCDTLRAPCDTFEILSHATSRDRSKQTQQRREERFADPATLQIRD